MAVPMPPYLQFLTSNGLVRNGGRVTTYTAGTTTPKATFTNAAGTINAANPVILNAAGLPDHGSGNTGLIWISGAYDFVVTNADGTDPVTMRDVTSFNTIAPAGTSYFQSFSGDGSTTVFSLSQNLGTDENVVLFSVNNIVLPPTGFTLSGTSITFAVAPPSGTNNVFGLAFSTSVAAASAAADLASGFATAANNSAVAAAASETTASTQAGIATTQAEIATTQAEIATTQATNAQNFAAAYSGTSTTSLLIQTGSRVFTTQASKLWVAGQFIQIASEANSSNYMNGTVTSYTGTTLTMNITNIGGSGTFADWSISISGGRGEVGGVGPPGGISGGTLTGALNWNTAQTIASAGTTDIGAATSNYVIVSGTTTITALGTIAQGAERIVRFSGVLILTHDATTMILLSGANITTAVGDIATFISEGSGNWRMTDYVRANGTALVGGGGGTWVALQTITASNVATVDFVNGTGGAVIDGTYRNYKILITDLVSITGSDILMRTSTNGGSSYDSGASDYKYWSVYGASNVNTVFGINSNGDSSIRLAANGITTNATDTCNIEISMYNPAGTRGVCFGYVVSMHNSGNTAMMDQGAAYRVAGADVDALQFFLSSGNISSGTFTLYGIA
jgi:hypothetical protein